MMRTLLLACAMLCLTGCGSREGNTPVMLLPDADTAERGVGPLSGELFTLTARPAVLSRETRTEISLTLEKPFRGKLLLIDSEGVILRPFREGAFEETTYTFEYEAPADLAEGAYSVILADEENNVVVTREILLTDDVMSTLR